MRNGIASFIDDMREGREAAEDDYEDMNDSQKLSVDVLVADGTLKGEFLAFGAVILGSIIGTIIRKYSK